MPAVCIRICTSSATGSPRSISSTLNGELSSHSRAPLVFMKGDHRTRFRKCDKQHSELGECELLYVVSARRVVVGLRRRVATCVTRSADLRLISGHWAGWVIPNLASIHRRGLRGGSGGVFRRPALAPWA